MTEKRYDMSVKEYRQALAKIVVFGGVVTEANQHTLDEIFSKDEEVIKMFDWVAPKIEELGIEINLPRTSA